MLLGEDVKIRAGESGFTMLVAHPPYADIRGGSYKSTARHEYT